MALIRTPVLSCHLSALPLEHTVRRKCSLGARPCGERVSEVRAVTAPCLGASSTSGKTAWWKGVSKVHFTEVERGC